MNNIYRHEPKEFPWFLHKHHLSTFLATAYSMTKGNPRLDEYDLVLDFFLMLREKKEEMLQEIVKMYNDDNLKTLKYLKKALRNYIYSAIAKDTRRQLLMEKHVHGKPMSRADTDWNLLAEEKLEELLAKLKREDYRTQFKLMAAGYKNKEIVEELGMNCNTVATNKRRILEILNS